MSICIPASRFRFGIRPVRTLSVRLAMLTCTLLLSCQAAETLTQLPLEQASATQGADAAARAGDGSLQIVGQPTDAPAAGPDARFLNWDQGWKVEADGTVRQFEHRRIQLLHSRPVRTWADQRISYCEGRDQLRVIAARTILPDGRELPVPDYALNTAGTDDVAGWPEYAGWRDRVISFSGVQNNAVLDLEYEITTQPRVLPWVSADLRLHEEYPATARTVTVTLPAGKPLLWQLDGLADAAPGPQVATKDGLTTYTWSFADLPAAANEPQAPIWQKRCGRLRFTSCPSAAAWVAALTAAVEQAAQPTEAIKEMAKTALGDEFDTRARVGKLSKKLRDFFNFVVAPRSMRDLRCRPAAEIHRCNYGNPLEAAAFCGALLRAADLNPRFMVCVESPAWSPSDTCGLTDSAFAGVVLGVDTDDGPLWIHPQNGLLSSEGDRQGRWLLAVGPDQALERTYLPGRGEVERSELALSGNLTLNKEAAASGEVRVRLTGAFYEPTKLEAADAQQSLLAGLLGRLAGGLKVSGYSMQALSAESLRATVNVAGGGPLPKAGELYVLTLGNGPAFLDDFALPLARSYRHTDVQIPGPFREEIDLTIELPEGWQAWAVPAAMAPVQGEWGSISQEITLSGRKLRLRRTVDIGSARLSPQAFSELRPVLNALRADGSRQVLLGAGPKPVPTDKTAG